MVFLHIPPNYTEEEIMLQAKYDKLKRKKKALHVMKVPRQEPERITPVKVPQNDGRDAREIAKKLLKSGAISAIKKTPKRDELSGFKRPGGSSGRKSEALRLSGYHPFAGNIEESRPSIKKLYTSMNKTDDDPDWSPEQKKQSPKVNRSSVFVKGLGVNETLVKRTFSEHGEIANIKIDTEKRQGVVTFKNPESAESCISALNGSVFNGYQLAVSFNNRRPPKSAQDSQTLADVAVNKDPSRELVIYDDVFF
ncbi:negative elongation factor E-like isoform X2 [Cimex lectularius]|uniref:Negative elongation factor E n=1 Tax=Cimex lectularius TaxID=79782 RepID=A0A8I6THY3_CIMLE|nr:negative elongation factor E-like isoform X2 [Cimex lectularius]